MPPIGRNFSASQALVRAKELAAEADREQQNAGIGDVPRATAKASVATALATIAMAMRQED